MVDGALLDHVEPRACWECGRRLLWVMRGAGCCLGPEIERATGEDPTPAARAGQHDEPVG